MEGSRLGGEVAELSLHSAIVLYQLIVVKMSVQKLCLLLMCYQMVLTSYVSATNNRKDSLLVLTTCNQIRFTVQLLSSVRAAVPLMDCVVVDDHSTDGTVEVLRRKGFAVITKDSPKGLTHSWNIGYKLAQQERYKYVFFANNDIVFSPLAIRVMQDQLLNNSLVVPLTSAKGAGHNPLQGIEKHHKTLPAAVKRLQAENPWHAEKIQQILFGQAYQTVNASNSVYQLVHSFSVLSRVKSRWRFNGFFFGVNMNLIKAAAHGVDLLFDPRDVMVEQENHLVESMSREKMFPVVAISAFVYHHKSATVGSARMPLPAQHAALLGINSSTGSATVHSYFYFHNESGVLKRFDRRENLRYYHQNKTLPGNSQTTREYVNYAVERQTEVERCLVALRDVSICESWTMVLIVPSHWSIAVDSLLPSVVYVERASGEAAEMQLKVPKRENWYKPALYTTADLIVVADSDFLLSSVLRSHWLHKNQYRMSARATMIACALVSNSSLQEVDSIGNYDAFIALNRSVPTAAAAFPMQCTTGCPAVFTAANTTTFISTKSSARSETDADIRSLTGENGVKEVFLPIQELGTNLSGMTLTQLESITKAIVRTFPFLVSGKPK